MVNWGGGGYFFGSQNNTPHPTSNFLHKICLDCRKLGAPEKAGPLKMQRPLVLISLWKIISFFFQRLVFVTRPERKYHERLTLSSLGPCCIIFSARSDTQFRKKPFFFPPNERCTETWNSYTCRCNHFYFNVYYLYMYMYCIYKV